MNDQFASGKTFLIEDPAWAEDFAPNGMSVPNLYLMKVSNSSRHSRQGGRNYDAKALCRVRVSSQLI